MIERLAAFAMGTRFELVLAGAGAARAAGEAALAEVEDRDRRWSAFRPDSVVSLLNREAGRRPVRVDHDTFELLALAERVRAESGGLFDVCVGDAMERWGFRGDTLTAEAWKTRSRDEERGGARGGDDAGAPPGSLRLRGESSSVQFARGGVSIDPGGIAKGCAVDAALRVLREAGVPCALIHGGTSCVGAIGAPPGNAGWRVALGADPGAPVVTLRDACLAVSSPAGREVGADRGARLGHIIDPRTGAPAACARVACVIGPSAALCDAWAKPAIIERGRPGGLPTGYTTAIDAGGVWWIDGPDEARVESKGGRAPARHADARTA